MKIENGKVRNTMLKRTPVGLGDWMYLGPSSTIKQNSSNLDQPYLESSRGQVSLDSQKRLTIPWGRIEKNTTYIIELMVIPLTNAES